MWEIGVLLAGIGFLILCIFGAVTLRDFGYAAKRISHILDENEKSIKEITEYMNFPNQSFLGKYFKEHVGMSPSEYRKE